MKTVTEQDYTINICTDIIEWAKEFYAMPEGAELTNADEVSCECMGFAEITGKEVWIFIPKEYNLKNLKETIAHEIGHIIEMEYPTNPKQTDGNNEFYSMMEYPANQNDDAHEMKAEHYANFYLLVDSIVGNTVSALNANCS